MRRIATFIFIMACIASTAYAARSGFGLDAFNRAVSAATKGSVAFSPISFELDCVVFSEAFDALKRAKIAEAMGVLNGLENVYAPIAESLAELNTCNATFLHARAFCLPDERRAHVAYRKWMQDSFKAEAFSFDFRKGAECWFRSKMDGDMEDFSLSDNLVSARHFSYFDLASFKCALTNVASSAMLAQANFTPEGGGEMSVDYVHTGKAADIWARKNHAVVRLPISDGVWFFAVLPNKDMSIGSVRSAVTSSTIYDIITGINSITETGISHGLKNVYVPVMDISSVSNLTLPFKYFGITASKMERIDPALTPHNISQYARFQFGPAVERPPCPPSVTKDSAGDSRIFLNRPFLFFVYHENSNSIPMVGQFTGRP